MKLKAYSQNNAFKHLLLHTCRRFSWLPMVMTLLTGFVFIGLELLSENRYISIKLQMYPETAFSFKGENLWILFPYFLVAVSVISAFVMFSFLFKKRSASMMLLTGVSRAELFMTRYIFGLLSTLIPSLVTFFVLLCLGASNVGKSIVINENTVIMLLIVCAIVFYSYTVASIAAAMCGRAIEFFIVCAVFYLGVQGLLLFGVMMLASFLYGFGYSIRSYTNARLPYDYKLVFDKYSASSVHTIFGKAFDEYTVSGNPAAGISLDIYLSKLIWMLVIAAILVPVAVMIFKRRNAEFDGKPNANKYLFSVCTVIISLALSSLLLFCGNSFTVLAGVAALFAFLCFTLHTVFNGTVRKAFGAWKYILPSAASIFVFALLCYSGMFGYSDRIPDASEIASVKMTYSGGNRFVGASGTRSYNNITSTTVGFDQFPELVSEADINTVVNIHKAILEDGSRAVSKSHESNYSDTVVYTDYYIVYKLKDGREVIRCYPQMKLSTLYSTLAVSDTEAYKDLEETMIKHLYNNSYEYVNGKEPNYSAHTFFISDNMLSTFTPFELTASETKEFLEAISFDKSRLSFSDEFHPAEDCLGVIWLHQSILGENTQSVNTQIYVYESFEKTLDFLENKALTRYFKAEYTVRSIEIVGMNYYGTKNITDWAIDRYFLSEYDDKRFVSGSSTLKYGTVDEADFDEVLAKTRNKYFADSGNKYAIITLVNAKGEEVTTVKYIDE